MRQRQAKWLGPTRIAVFLCTLLVAIHSPLTSQDRGDPQATESNGKATPNSDAPSSGDSEKSEGQGEYEVRKRRFGTELDPVTRLERTLPKGDSLFEVSLPEGLAEAKKNVSRRYGLKLGISYQSLYQRATESLTETDTAWGGWFVFEAAWTAVNRGEDWQGKFVVTVDGRHAINPSSNTIPGLFMFDVGSLWATDAAFFDWNLYPAVFFWEQTVKKEEFAFRLGQQGALSVIDPFRFQDVRSAFTGSAATSPVGLIPVASSGLGISGKWWPFAESGLYVSAVVNDINAPSGEIDWSGLLDEGEVFAGGEVGYTWFREKNDFDHTHLTVWYADEVSTAPWPTESGWGIKVHGSKQWNHVVGFGDYGYNTVEGGGLGVTVIQQAVNLGVAQLRPLSVEGELALVASWAEPTDDDLRDQWGLEAYWKLLVFSNLWISPGVQYLVDPTFNTVIDSLAIYQVKLSLFL